MGRYLAMETSPFLLLFLLGYCLAVIEGELRCYCNESGCVSTAYMCKSSAGQCFTALEVRGEVTHQTHGCVDSLAEELRTSCQQNGGQNGGQESRSAGGNTGRHSPGGRGSNPVLLCCKEHMCNYPEDLDVNVILTRRYNGTFHRGGPSDIHSRTPHNDRDEERDLWFKAAVIAVPIAGGFILVLLVLLAVRMLKADSRRHQRLVQYRRERSLTKAHLYIADHFVGKASKQQCSLFNEKPSHSHQYTDSGTSSLTHTYPYHMESSCPHSAPHCDSSSFSQPFTSTPSDGTHATTNPHSHHHNHRQHHISPTQTTHTCGGSDSESSSKLTSCSTKPGLGDNGFALRSSGATDTDIAHRGSNSAGAVCGARDICVRLDRSGQPMPQIHRTGRKGAGRGGVLTSLTAWDRQCATPPPAIV